MRFLFIVALLSLQKKIIYAQTADQIVNKHFTAIGGKEKLISINNMYMEGEIEFVGFPMANSGPLKIYLIKDKGLLVSMGNEAPAMIDCITNEGGWFVNTLLGKNTPVPFPDSMVSLSRDQLVIGGALFNYAERGSKLTLLGSESVDGIDAYKLDLVTKNGAEYIYLIDTSSFYILKTIVNLNINIPSYPIKTITTFNDYDYQKRENGLIAPFSWSTDYIYTEGKQTINFTIKNIEINKTIGEAIFKISK